MCIKLICFVVKIVLQRVSFEVESVYNLQSILQYKLLLFYFFIKWFSDIRIFQMTKKNVLSYKRKQFVIKRFFLSKFFLFKTINF